MEYFAQIVVNGLITGGIYALAALGFALIFGVLRLVNFAHGVTCVIGGYTAYVVTAVVGLPFWFSLPSAMLVGAAVGYIVERIAFRPFRNASTFLPMVSSLACAIIGENLIAAVFGHEVRSFRAGIVSPTRYSLFGATITNTQVIILAIAVVLFLLVYLYLKKTPIGRQTLAVSDDPDAAATWGIHGRGIITTTCMVGSALAGAAGFLIALDLDADPYMGTEILFKAFAANLIFGLGSVPGAVAGGFSLGLLENLVGGFLSSRYKSAYTFMFLVLILIWRPRGILDVRTRRFE